MVETRSRGRVAAAPDPAATKQRSKSSASTKTPSRRVIPDTLEPQKAAPRPTTRGAVKRRADDPVARSDSNKRAKINEVRPGTLHVINSGQRKNTSPQSTGPCLIVPIHRKSDLMSTARAVGRPEQVEEQAIQAEASHPASEDEQLQEQVDEQFQQDMLQRSDQLDEDEAAHGAAEEEVGPLEEDVEQLPDRSGNVPPQSGQGDLPEVATQREMAPSTPQRVRKGPARKPKTALSDRVLEEHASRHAAKPASSAPGRKTKATQDGPSLSKEQLSRLGIPLGQSSHRQNSSQDKGMPVENIRVEGNEDEGEEDEGEEDGGEEDGGEEDEGDEEVDDLEDAARDSLLHPAPSRAEGQSTVHVESKAVIAMYRLMRKPSWTNNGIHWVRDVLHPQAAEGERAPEPRTSSGKVIQNHVIFLKRLYRSAPSVRRLAGQNDFLRHKHDETTRAIVQIRAEVQGIRRKYERLLQDDKKKLGLIRLRHDLINWIIPSLVILLHDFFFLGGSGKEDKDGYWDLPSEGGEFTATTLTILGRITGWIYLLAESIRDEVQLSRPKGPDQGDDESSTAADTLPYDRLKKRAEERMKLYDLAKQFRIAVNDALAELDEEAAEAAGRRKEREKRFRQVQAEREQEAREAEEKRQRHYEIMRVDAQRAREDPYAGIDPLSLLWIKRQKEDQKREAERQREQAERERMGSPQLDSGVFGVFGDESPVRQARDERRRGKQPAFVLHDDGYRGRLWTEDEIDWLGDRLEEGGVPDYESWATELRCKVEDVKAEADRQRQLMRSLARKKGKRAPAWALD